MRVLNGKFALISGTAVFAVVAASAALAQFRTFNLPAQSATKSIPEFARQAGIQIVAPGSKLRKVKTRAISGQQDVRSALNALLEGTGLQIVADDGRTVTLGATKTSSSVEAIENGAATLGNANDEEAEINIVGTHIRGAPVIAPVITVSHQDMLNAGQTDLGAATRVIPQNFNGGQNPNIGLGITGDNFNLNSTSSVNLRGLGADATLTLLDGHRMPTDGAYAGVDISAIPVAAVDHVDIVMDGASAIYGSDAVGGVVNVVLKRDVDGITTSTRIGTSTDGGDSNQQADIVAGTHWSGGGMFFAYDFAHNGAIWADQRGYTSSMVGPTTIYPETRRHAALVSGHQDINNDIEFKIDATYDKRWSEKESAASSDAGVNVQDATAKLQTFVVSPEFDIKVGGRWQVKFLGSAGRDLTDFFTKYTESSTLHAGCYCDTAYSAEANADGPLFQLPGGSASMAGGIGWRINRQAYSDFVSSALTQHYNNSQRSFYGFGEISLPIIGPEQDIAGLRRLVVSAAGRYEDYPGMARLGTPKVALLYEPDRNITLKVSWGKSFKAPTLYQKYLAYDTYLLSAASYNVGPTGTSVLYVSGGNPTLKPETATNLTAGFDIHPVFIPGLKIEGGYFDIHYRNRIVEPITGTLSSAFANPGYASLIDYAPMVDEITQLVSGSSDGLPNYSGAAYSPSTVVAIVDDRYRNVSAQIIHGADFSINYLAKFGDKSSINTQISVTYLSGQQSLAAALPSTQLAGIVFNPPHWRARGGTTYNRGDYNVSAFVNYIGSNTDNRFTPTTTVKGNATLDLDVTLPLFRRLDGRPGTLLSVTLNNALNQKPALTRITGATDWPFDSTNFTAIGRMISIGLSRSW